VTDSGREVSRGTPIVTPCPSCGRRTLFIGAGGHLTCSVIGCKEPSVEAWVEKHIANSVPAESVQGLLERWNKEIQWPPPSNRDEKSWRGGLYSAYLSLKALLPAAPKETTPALMPCPWCGKQPRMNEYGRVGCADVAHCPGAYGWSNPDVWNNRRPSPTKEAEALRGAFHEVSEVLSMPFIPLNETARGRLLRAQLLIDKALARAESPADTEPPRDSPEWGEWNNECIRRGTKQSPR